MQVDRAVVDLHVRRRRRRPCRAAGRSADSTTDTGAPPVPRRSTSGRPSVAQYQPVGRRRSEPARDQRVEHRQRPRRRRTAAGRRRRAAVRRRRSTGAAPSTYGLVGSSTAASTRRPNSASGMVHQVGVERIVPGDQHAQRLVAGPAGPSRLLPQRGQRARIAGQQHGVQTGHVDAEFQRVGRGEAEQRAVEQPLLQLAPLLAQVAGPVGGHPVGQLRHRPRSARRRACGRARPRPRAGTGRRPACGPRWRPRRPAGRRSPSAPSAGRPTVGVRRPRSGAGQQRRLPQPERDARPRRGVLGDRGHRQSGEPGGRGGRVPGGGRGQHEDRRPAAAYRRAAPGAAGGSPARRASRRRPGTRGTRR